MAIFGLSAEEAVAVIIVWTILRDFLIAPVLVRWEIQRNATQIVEQFFVGIAQILSDPQKKAALQVILDEITPLLKKGALKGFAARPPPVKDMIALGIANKLGLLDLREMMLGGPGQGAGQSPDGGPSNGPKDGRKWPWRR